MTSFWLAVASLLFVAIFFVLIPIIRFKQGETKSQLASSWYLQRLQELEVDRQSGRFNQQEYEQAVVELKLTAKDELTEHSVEQNPGQTQQGKKLQLIALFIMATVVIGFYWFEGNYKPLQDWQHTLKNMPELSQKVLKDSSEQVSTQELMAFALGLRTQLSKEDNALGWMLLGRVLTALQDYHGAIDAFEKSYQREPTSVANIVSYAQALQAIGEEFEVKRSLNLLRQALQLQPNNEMAVILFGEGNFLLQDYQAAKLAFDAMLSILQDGDPRKMAIEQRLAFIEQELGLGQGATNKVVVEVSIAPEFNGKVSDFPYLFVFAKTPDMPMPIAVQKISLTNLPVTVELTDQDMMLPGKVLSDYAAVDIYARLSLDEVATTRSGEWQGTALKVETSQSGVVKVVIGEQL